MTTNTAYDKLIHRKLSSTQKWRFIPFPIVYVTPSYLLGAADALGRYVYENINVL